MAVQEPPKKLLTPEEIPNSKKIRESTPSKKKDKKERKREKKSEKDQEKKRKRKLESESQVCFALLALCLDLLSLFFY